MPTTPAPQKSAPAPAQAENGAPATANPLAAAVDSLLEIAGTLRKEKEALLTRVDANRQMLRNLATQGAATEPQSKMIAEIYPPRERKTKAEAGS